MDWQDIASAPKDGETVLLYFPDRFWMTDEPIATGFFSDGWYWTDTAGQTMDAFGSGPTHWMPYPKPPHA